jgi:hypothetical protein
VKGVGCMFEDQTTEELQLRTLGIGDSLRYPCHRRSVSLDKCICVLDQKHVVALLENQSHILGSNQGEKDHSLIHRIRDQTRLSKNKNKLRVSIVCFAFVPFSRSCMTEEYKHMQQTTKQNPFSPVFLSSSPFLQEAPVRSPLPVPLDMISVPYSCKYSSEPSNNATSLGSLAGIEKRNLHL